MSTSTSKLRMMWRVSTASTRPWQAKYKVF